MKDEEHSDFVRIPYGVVLYAFKNNLRKELYLYSLLQIAFIENSQLDIALFRAFIKRETNIRDSRTINDRIDRLIQIGWVKLKKKYLFPISINQIRELISDKEEIAFYYYLSYSKKSFDGFLYSAIMKVINIKQEACDDFINDENAYLGASVRKISKISGLVISRICKIKQEAIRGGFIKVEPSHSFYKELGSLKFSNKNIPVLFLEKQKFGFRIGNKIIHCDKCESLLKTCKLAPLEEKKILFDSLSMNDFQIAKIEVF